MKSHKSAQFHPFKYWLISHLRAAFFALGELVSAPITSFMTIVVIGIAMALPAGLYLILENLQTVSDYWGRSPNISLYIKQETPGSEIQQLMQQLQGNPAISAVKYISPEQGLQDFAKWNQLSGLTTQLIKNPLPGVVVITPNIHLQTPGPLQNLLASLKQLPMVEASQMDMLWVERLYNIFVIGKRIIYSMALFFSIGVLLIIGNTIRTAMQTKRQEIQVLKLIGATHRFISRPLLYRGLFYGLWGGAIAWSLISILLSWLEAPAQALARTYNQGFAVLGLDVQTGVTIMVICALLGWLGSWVALRFHLHAKEW